MKALARRVVRTLGYDIVPYRPGSEPPSLPADVSSDDRTILERVAPFTMTSVARQVTLIQAVRHLARRKVQGSFVECGVWRGGSSMAIALSLIQERETSRDLYLFDTFEGMTPPTDVDRTPDGVSALTYLENATDKVASWCVAAIDDVRTNLTSTGYPAEHLHLVKGCVEDTIPAHSPTGRIALLRLDTDWYESTKHELVHLFPLLSEGGVLIIDDYGHWEGAKRAVDEYFAALPRKYYLHRIDFSGRLLVT